MSRFFQVSQPVDNNGNPIGWFSPGKTVRCAVTPASTVIPYVFSSPLILIQSDTYCNVEFFGQFDSPVPATFDSFFIGGSVQMYQLSMTQYIKPRPEVANTPGNLHFGEVANWMAGYCVSVIGSPGQGIFASSVANGTGNIWVTEMH